MTTQIKARLGGSTICWREIAPGYAVASFTAKLHGWADTRRFIVVHETVREDKDSVAPVARCARLHLPHLGDQPH